MSIRALWRRLWTSIALGLLGFRDALCFHRCVVLFVHDPRILVKTGHTFVLNGVIFLGSVLLLQHALLPAIGMLLGAALPPGPAGVAVAALHALYSVLWLLPAYILSFIVNCVWYSELAELAVAAAQRRTLQARVERRGLVAAAPPAPLKVRRPDALTMVSQELYRSALFAVVFGQVTAAGYLPRPAGPALRFALLSWLYALYCFDYKYSLHGVPLEARIAFIESHWAFFLGFGAATVLPLVLLSFYISAAAVGVAFPLFILTACGSDPRGAYERLAARPGSGQAGRAGSTAAPWRLRVFAPACWATTAMIRGLAALPRGLRWLRSDSRGKGRGGSAGRGRGAASAAQAGQGVASS